MEPQQPSGDEAKLRAGIISGFGAYLLWGMLTFYWKELAEFNAFELIGWRIVAATVILLVVIAVTRRGAPVWATFRNPSLLWRVALAAVLLSNNWTL
jgi:chloramphenicol-sensitive protein RarD